MDLFYPSHDIALANGVRHFNPPAAALMLQEDLASLADVWNLPYSRGEWSMPLPWGWDWDTRRLLHEAYRVKMTQLPTDSELERIRLLSSRQTTVALCQRLEELVPGAVWHRPVWLQSEDELAAFFGQQEAAGQRYVLKSPWSSSGRGLFVSHARNRNGELCAVSREQLCRQGMAVVRKMGGVMGEQWIEHKERDFAMLFFASSTEVRFVGYSLFDNDDGANGATYRQGYLLSNERIEQLLTHGDEALTGQLQTLAHAYEQILNELLQPLMGHAWQVGYMGIDMLTYRPIGDTVGSPPLRIHPCVELNLRCTMGVVCRLWYEQHQREGLFRISPMQQNGHFNAEFLPTL